MRFSIHPPSVAVCSLAACLWAGTLLLGCRSAGDSPYTGFIDEPVSAVATQISGKITSIPVREGDRVTKGQALALLEASAREAAVAEAEANVVRAEQALRETQANLRAAFPAVKGAAAEIEGAQAALDETQINFDRIQYLAQRNSAPASDVDAARARLLEARASVEAMTAAKTQTQGKVAAALAAVGTARANVQSSKAALEMARVELAQARIESPFDGLVVAHNLEEGEWAAPGSPVVTVEDTTRPWVRLDVEETQFGHLKVGGMAELNVVALPGRTFKGRISQIGAEGDFAINRDVKRGHPDVRTFLVRVSFDEISDQLRPGMTAEVRLIDVAEPPVPGVRGRQ
jgi:HlyD family secretion protein